MAGARIRVGVGGWNFAPWRANFYPQGLAHHRELTYASERLDATEINSTYYGTQKPASFAKWRDETCDDFMFSVKASRFATNRKVLAEAGESIDRFIGSGISQLGAKLGPIVWQFATSKVFDAADFEAFLTLLPREVDGLDLRHALDVRHESFASPHYLALARRYACATVFTESDDYPRIADLTGNFVYARLMRSDPALAKGYAPKVLDDVARSARAWSAGAEPAGLPRIEPTLATNAPRDVFVFFISGAKEKNPAAAMALHERLR